MSSILLEIITPDKIAYSDQVEMVTAPSADGQIGILPNHVPLFARLVEGEVKISKKSGDLLLAIGGGYIQVTPDKISILVSAAVHANEINERQVLEAKKRAQDALKEKLSPEAVAEMQSIIRRTDISLKVLKKRSHLGSRSSLPS